MGRTPLPLTLGDFCQLSYHLTCLDARLGCLAGGHIAGYAPASPARRRTPIPRHLVVKFPPIALIISLGASLMITPMSAMVVAQETDTDSIGVADEHESPTSNVSRWLDEVRAQRRALQEQRRAELDARRRAMNPVGAAQQEAREAEFLRRRQQRREMIEQDRKRFMSRGLSAQDGWLPASPAPLSPAPLSPAPLSPVPLEPGDEMPALNTAPRGWDNGWYFHGW